MARRKSPTKKAASKGGKKSSTKSGGKQPKFGSAAWFAKYPAANKVKGRMKSKSKKKK